MWYIDFDYGINIIIGVVVLFISSYLFGQIAGKLILLRTWNAIGSGCLIGLAIILTTSFFSGWTGFLAEGIFYNRTYVSEFKDYIIKPMYWLNLFGIIPALLVGIWFGLQVKLRGKLIMKS